MSDILAKRFKTIWKSVIQTPMNLWRTFGMSIIGLLFEDKNGLLRMVFFYSLLLDKVFTYYWWYFHYVVVAKDVKIERDPQIKLLWKPSKALWWRKYKFSYPVGNSRIWTGNKSRTISTQRSQKCQFWIN